MKIGDLFLKKGFWMLWVVHQFGQGKLAPSPSTAFCPATSLQSAVRPSWRDLSPRVVLGKCLRPCRSFDASCCCFCHQKGVLKKIKDGGGRGRGAMVASRCVSCVPPCKFEVKSTPSAESRLLYPIPGKAAAATLMVNKELLHLCVRPAAW